MYYYAPDDNKKGKRAGLAALACYLGLFLAVCLMVSFRMDYDVPQSEGILVDFGDDSQGEGEDAVALSQRELPAASEASASEEYLTQQTEEAPALSDASAQRDSHVQTAQNNQSSNAHDRSDTETREINRRALFPGRSTTSDAVSQGATRNASENSGSEAGGDGSTSGTGTGTEGISFDLKGRRPIGSLPRPGYDANDAQGIVIVEITVDDRGRVQAASFRPHGSTTQDARLLEAALKAARAARFTPSESNALQTGSITYIFRLQ